MASDDEVRRLRDEASDDEEIAATFRRLRQQGHSRLEAVRLILDALDVSLSEAKTLLLTHDTWGEVQTTDQAAPGSADDQAGSSGGGEEANDTMPPAPG